ncbi:choice-of-anchor Q domain-containing protein [Chloroflexota bacterium]
MRLMSAILVVCLPGLFLPAPARRGAPATWNVLYVKPGGNGNCSSWADACELQTALAFASPLDQIWVAEGTHTPTSATGNRSTTFLLVGGVSVYGGFAGTETSLDQRDWVAHPTVLSGDLQGDDGPDFANYGDNSYHVVTCNHAVGTAVLDGFTIRGGNANLHGGTTNDHGGGINGGGRLTVMHVIVSDNMTLGSGGGMYTDGIGPTLVDVTFRSNSANSGGGFHYTATGPLGTNVTFSDDSAENAGGIYGETSSSAATLENVTFSGNTATGSGGGMFQHLGNATLANVTFSGNRATQDGGGMFNVGDDVTLTDVSFRNNVSEQNGGGMANMSDPTLDKVAFSGNVAKVGGGLFNEIGSPSLTNVTFSGNIAGAGGGLANLESSPTMVNVTFSANDAYLGATAIGNWDNSNPVLANAIVWARSADIVGTSSGELIFNDGTSSTTVTYSDVQGGHFGAGNIGGDPHFVRQPGPGGDGVMGTDDDDYGDLRLQRSSPAIDAGHNAAVPAGITTDMDGLNRFVDVDSVPNSGAGTAPIVDMGAYEAHYQVHLPLVMR